MSRGYSVQRSLASPLPPVPPCSRRGQHRPAGWGGAALVDSWIVSLTIALVLVVLLWWEAGVVADVTLRRLGGDCAGVLVRAGWALPPPGTATSRHTAHAMQPRTAQPRQQLLCRRRGAECSQCGAGTVLVSCVAGTTTATLATLATRTATHGQGEIDLISRNSLPCLDA